MIVFDFLITYSMDLETALTFTHGHFNEVVFAVYYIGTLSTKGMYTIASKKKCGLGLQTIVTSIGMTSTIY